MYPGNPELWWERDGGADVTRGVVLMFSLAACRSELKSLRVHEKLSLPADSESKKTPSHKRGGGLKRHIKTDPDYSIMF